MNRRAFLKSADPSIKARFSPEGIKSTQSGIAPYAGPWTSNEIAHLLKRTMFGANKHDTDYFLTMSMNEAVDELLIDASAVSPPVRDYGLVETETGMHDDPAVAIGNTWVNDVSIQTDPLLRSAINNHRVEGLRKWWAGLIINQNRTIWEKMVLFWHHHFSVQKERSRKSYCIIPPPRSAEKKCARQCEAAHQRRYTGCGYAAAP